MGENVTSVKTAYKLDGYRDPLWEELIDGKVVVMAVPRISHNRAVTNISMLFAKYLTKQSAEFLPFGTGLYIADRERYIPDGMVVCDPDKVQDKGIVGAPDLVVEVLSRSTSRYDRGHKMDVYEKFGVREYWIVSPSERSVEQYVLDGGRYYLVNAWQRIPIEHWTGKEEEQEPAPEEFPCFIFPDLIVKLDDVFGKATV